MKTLIKFTDVGTVRGYFNNSLSIFAGIYETLTFTDNKVNSSLIKQVDTQKPNIRRYSRRIRRLTTIKYQRKTLNIYRVKISSFYDIKNNALKKELSYNRLRRYHNIKRIIKLYRSI